MKVNKETYFTIDCEYGPEEIKEKGSRFISYLFPVKDTVEVENHIATLRKNYKDSTHVCTAFRLGNEVGEETYFRYNDDGEPGGTAGLPIYNELTGKNYLNVLAAVIRYFGGTKLGTGGLVRAYAASARKVLDVSRSITVTVKTEITINFPYQLTGEIMHTVNQFSLEVIHRDYNSKGVSMKLAIPVSIMPAVAKAITDKSGGKIRI